MDENVLKRAIEYMFEIASLRCVKRGHGQGLNETCPSDNIAAHCHLVSVIAFVLALLEGADAYKAAGLGALHDVVEARTGDQTYIHKKYVVVDEMAALLDQTEGMPAGLRAAMLDYEERNERPCKEADIVKDADILAQLVLEFQYREQGNRIVVSFINSRTKRKKLKTVSAKAIHARMVDALNSDQEIAPGSWFIGKGSNERRQS